MFHQEQLLIPVPKTDIKGIDDGMYQNKQQERSFITNPNPKGVERKFSTLPNSIIGGQKSKHLAPIPQYPTLYSNASVSNTSSTSNIYLSS
jgi:hypothetical protein